MTRLIRLTALPLVVVALGCSSKDTTPVTQASQPDPVSADCDPLVPSHCGFPMPSNLWTETDASTKTGLHVNFTSAMLPRHARQKTDPAPFNALDGFSTGMTLMVHMPGATAAGLPTPSDLAASVESDSKTLLIDAETGEFVPHWSELDLRARNDDERTFMIRPAVRLKDAHRYIAAIRHVVDADGHDLAPTPAFVALRDGTPFDHPTIEPRRALYAEILGKTDKAGIARAELQLAWDFTTASRENTTRRLLHMRDEALAIVGEDGPTYTILEEKTDPTLDSHKRYLLEMTVPLYLDKVEAGGALMLDATGLPKQNGTGKFQVLVQVPKSAYENGAAPAGLLQNGHGLLGAKEEGDGGYLTMIGDKKNYVTFSVDFTGMSNDDVPTLTDTMSGDVGGFDKLVGRQHQGVLNSLLAMRMMKGRWAKDQAAALGHPLVDTSLCAYRGDSQGGIFGGTYMGVSTDVTRGLLSVPGAPYSILLNRSQDFGPFFVILSAVNDSALDVQMAIGLVQMLWDKTEPNGYIPYITDDLLPNTPSHSILIQNALGDHQVSELGAHYLARATKATLVDPFVRPIYGLETKKAPFSGNAIVEFDFGNPPIPDGDQPPTQGSDPHETVRRTPEAYDQADVFFRTGQVTQTCSGPCVIK